MKIILKNAHLLLLLIIILSCEDPGGEVNYAGFSFRIANTTNQSYEGEIVVGGIINQSFVATDSVKFEKTLEIGSAALTSHFIDESRWKPNLGKVRNLPSEKCYFKLKLSNGREEIISVNNTNDFFNLLMPTNNTFQGRNGFIFITITDTQISGKVSE